MRTEQILLAPRGAAPEKLASIHQVPAILPSQRRFLARWDGAHLAYDKAGELRLRDATGREIAVPRLAGDFRFSPDGRSVVCVTAMRGQIEIVDVASGQRRTMARYLSAVWLECSQDGAVVVNAPYPGPQRLLFVPWSGKQRTLARSDWFGRLAAGAASRKVVYFQGKRAFIVDTASDARPERFATLDGDVTNAEMARDGRSILAVTKEGAWRLAPDGSSERLLEARRIHTVWFSANGREALVAAPDRVFWKRPSGTLTRELDGIAGARFARTRAGVVIAHGKQASLWKPDDTLETLATHDRPLFGADEFAGGVVLWTGRALPQSNSARAANRRRHVPDWVHDADPALESPR